MGLEIFWSEFSRSKLEEIYQYYRLKAGKTVAKKIVNGIINHTINLHRNPEIGQIENVLDDKNREFRYLVFFQLQNNLLYKQKIQINCNSKRF